MWFEVAIVTSIFAVGSILFGHFEEQTPKWRRLLKLILFTAVAVLISHAFGRAWFWVLLGILLLVVLYIHAVWLPRNGVNGWTGQPREKYYALRGWRLPESVSSPAAYGLAGEPHLSSAEDEKRAEPEC